MSNPTSSWNERSTQGPAHDAYFERIEEAKAKGMDQARAATYVAKTYPALRQALIEEANGG